ncbi:sterile alpha motif domain-containing protein 12-like [Rhincodon typus]|uniref:sterile alpha motif domain-containing protein 12-like n=1 Tax=Rhincodon typus TaxID=259920 RepID=UPI0009A32AB0|nr:sterile alpha motif domain-containing protein 12-like [Rhincodon typus]
MDSEDILEPLFKLDQTQPMHHRNHHLQTLPLSYSGNQLELEECKIRVVQSTQMQSKPVSLWTQDEVCEWLRSQYPRQSSIFIEAMSEHAISGRALLRLTAGKLKQMGIAQESHRQLLLKEILQLHIRDDVESLASAFAEGQ